MSDILYKATKGKDAMPKVIIPAATTAVRFRRHSASGPFRQDPR
jgi:hypothetical protein